MTKKEMIEVIQQREAELWLNVKVDEKLFGRDHIITSKTRGEWCKIHNLMEELEIKPNNLLPENQKAIEMIVEKMKEEELN
jgi:nitrogenase molybdenum-iron protein alpha/beta subunit